MYGLERRRHPFEEGDPRVKAPGNCKVKRVSWVDVKGDECLVAEAKATRASKHGAGSCDLVINP